QAQDGIRDYKVTGVQTCALPITGRPRPEASTSSPIFRGSPCGFAIETPPVGSWMINEGDARITTPLTVALSLFENENRRRSAMGRNGPLGWEIAFSAPSCEIVGTVCFPFTAGLGGRWSREIEVSMASKSRCSARRTVTFLQTPPEEYERKPIRPDGMQSLSLNQMELTLPLSGMVASPTIWKSLARNFSRYH